MAEAASRVEALMSGATPETVDLEVLARAIATLAAGAELSTRELRMAAVGATTPVEVAGRQIRIVDEQSLTSRLLDEIWRRQGEERTFRRCAFGLTHAYYLPEERPDQPAAGNWANLGLFARTYVQRVRAAGKSEAHVGAIGEVFESLDGSTHQFWPYVLEREVSAVAALHRLGAAETSWVWRQMVRDSISDCREWSDEVFLSRLEAMMAALTGHEVILDEGLGLLLQRYASVANAPEHEALRDLCVKRWKSPLIEANRQTWLRFAGAEGLRLAAGWLGRSVIRAFFEAVSTRHSDERRTRFWARYAESIEEFWVYLSEEVTFQRPPAIQELRSLLGNERVRRVDHEHTSVFMMVMGEYAFVEFSDVGNALYIYERESLPFTLRGPGLKLPSFRDRQRATARLTHQGGWEPRARNLISDLTGVWIRGV
jgi:hypothetical protein